MSDYDRYDRLREALSATPAVHEFTADASAGWHHQNAATDMAADWTQAHDLPALALLDAAGRAEQLAARQALYSYLDAIWEAPKWRGQEPTASPAYDVVAALRDLLGAPVGNAPTVIATSRDPDPPDRYRPPLPPP